MAYEVTATRRRPQAFDALAGQEFVAETLKNTIESKKIAHAYLFSGPRGCGKTSTARIFSKALNCVNGPTASPCGKCANCLEITQGTSPDVIEIDGASNTSVNDIRQIKEEVLFAPQSSKYKIYIIDEVHMLSTSAFNALLKTIEEPPEYVIFVFATTELHKVPATIKSRCQQFNFRLVPIDTVEKLLEDAAKEIGIQADEEALYWVARESTGSIRDAYTLFDQVVAFSGDHLTYDKIRDKLGLVGVDRLNVIFEDCVASRTNDAILKLNEFLQNGISIEQFISNSTDYLRSLLLIKTGITKESLLGQSADRYSVNVLNAWNPIQIERAISLFLQLYRDIRYSLSPRYELELAISRLSWLSQYVSPMEVKYAIDQAKNLLLNAQTTVPTSVGQNPMNQNQRTQAQLAALMNPTSWQKSSQPQPSVNQAQPLQPKKPLPVFDALKNMPEYQNAQSISDSIQAKNAQNQQKLNQQTQIQQVQPQIQYEQQIPQNVQVQSQVQTSAQSQNVAQNFIPQQNFSANTETEVSLATNFVNIVPSHDFTKVSENELQQFVENELAIRNGVLAAAILETRNWKKLNEKIIFEVGNDFQKLNFDKNRQQFLDAFADIFGQHVDFEVILNKIEVVNQEEQAPESVKLLLSTFRGEIVGVGERSEIQKQDNAEQQSVNSETQSQNQTENQESDEVDETDESNSFDDFDSDFDD